MFAPRLLIAAGIALIAVSLGASGHGLWWLVGLVFVVGHGRHRWDACGHQRHRGGRNHGYRADVDAAAPRTPDAVDPAADRTSAQPDPSHDRHEAFPQR